MRIRQSVYIQRRPEDVFRFVSDPSNDRLWRSELVSVQPVGAVRSGLGTHLHQTVTYQGKTAEANVEVTEFDPPRRIGFRLHGGTRAHGCFDFRPEAGGTWVNASATVELKGNAVMLERYVRQIVEQTLAGDLERLRSVLEAESVS